MNGICNEIEEKKEAHYLKFSVLKLDFIRRSALKPTLNPRYISVTMIESFFPKTQRS